MDALYLWSFDFEVEITPTEGALPDVEIEFVPPRVETIVARKTEFEIKLLNVESLHEVEVHIEAGPPGTKMFLPNLYKLRTNLMIEAEERGEGLDAKYQNAPYPSAHVGRVSIPLLEDPENVQSSSKTTYEGQSEQEFFSLPEYFDGEQHYPYRSVILE